jgi:N-methylhydantoinase B/oxoprolinase/acetone carboxylase alpha subunit
VPAAPAGCGVRGWGRDGLGTGARGRGARARRALKSTTRLFGGKDGACNEVVVERAGAAYRSPHWSKDEDIRMVAGDAVHVRTPGGGGYGDPLARDPELVRRDVARGYFKIEDAARDYGVLVTGEPLAVDPEATARLRQERRARPSAG